MVLVLIIFLILTRPAFASPDITFSTVSDPVIIGDQFEVKFSVVNNDIGNSYHYKLVGVGVTLDNLPDSGCDNRYDSCPTFSIGTSETTEVTALAKVISGSGQIKIRIAQVESHDTKDSALFSVNLLSPTPTNTPTPTPIPTPTLTPSPTLIPTATSTPLPTSTPTPSNSPTPTKTPTPTHTPTPTKTPTPTNSPSNTPTLTVLPTTVATPTDSPTASPMPTEEEASPEVLGVVDAITPQQLPPTPTSAPKNTVTKNWLPGLLIGVGGLFLLFPLILSKLRHD